MTGAVQEKAEEDEEASYGWHGSGVKMSGFKTCRITRKGERERES